MTSFMNKGSAYMPIDGQDTVKDFLPLGNYIVCESMSGLYFQQVPTFDEPAKMYGDIDKRARRILNTFLDRERATGVLLAGEKGSGKSQLARNVSVMGYELGIPTILINAPWHGEAFNALLSSVTQPAIIIMDEFEKVYPREFQEAILTLLDGTMTSKKLFILTVNDPHAVNHHMKNRPGRLFYSLNFTGVGGDFVREYCEDNLENKSHVDDVVKVSALFEAFNFDMLKALVEEMNRYSEGAYESLEMLNAKPATFNYGKNEYDVKVTANGLECKLDEPMRETPLTAHGGVMSFYATFPKSKAKEAGVKLDSDGDMHVMVQMRDARKLDAERGIYLFQPKEGVEVIFKRREQEKFDIRELSF